MEEFVKRIVTMKDIDDIDIKQIFEYRHLKEEDIFEDIFKEKNVEE